MIINCHQLAIDVLNLVVDPKTFSAHSFSSNPCNVRRQFFGRVEVFLGRETDFAFCHQTVAIGAHCSLIVISKRIWFANCDAQNLSCALLKAARY